MKISLYIFFLSETCTVLTRINSNLNFQHLIFRNPRGRIMFLLIVNKSNTFLRTILRGRLNALTFKTCFVEEDCTCSSRCFTTFDSFLLLRCLIGFSLRFRAYSLEVWVLCSSRRNINVFRFQLSTKIKYEQSRYLSISIKEKKEQNSLNNLDINLSYSLF